MESVKKLTGLIPANAVEYARKIFKIAVFGVKNNLVLAGILLIGYCVIAPAVFITATIDRSVSVDAVETLMGIYSIIAAYVGGLLIPAVMFAYVQKRRDRDFYHSMPVRRGQYFIGYFFSGFVMFAVPYLLMCIVMGLLTAFQGGVTFEYIIQTLALYIVIYSTVTFSVMFSGSFLSSIVTMLFLNAFPFVAIYCSLLTVGTIDMEAYMTLLLPYIYIFTPLAGGYGVYDSFMGQYGWLLWVQLGLAVVELVLAFLMYKYRKGETTMAVAFPKTRYILQYGAMFVVAMFSVFFFGALFYSMGSISTEVVVWTSILVFATFVFMNMVLEQDFRAAFHKIRHLFIFAGSYAVVLILIVAIVSSLPHWIVPIRTDAVLIRHQHFINTYEAPDGFDDDYYGYYLDGEYAGEYGIGRTMDEHGKTMYQLDLGEDYYMVTDPKQVAELTKRIYDYRNDTVRTYVNYYQTEGEYYYTTLSLYTLKPGKEVKSGMYLDQISNISSQQYTIYLGNISASDVDGFKDGMTLIETGWRSLYY